MPRGPDGAAHGLIKAGKAVSEAALNQIKMAFRAYGPCFGCATHALPGHPSILVRVFEQDRELVQVVPRE